MDGPRGDVLIEPLLRSRWRGSVKLQPSEKLAHCRNEGRVLALTEVDMLKLLPKA